MQISRILSTTTFNFNIDSENYGAEIEMDYVPAAAPVKARFYVCLHKN